MSFIVNLPSDPATDLPFVLEINEDETQLGSTAAGSI